MWSLLLRSSLIFLCVGCAAAPAHVRTGFVDPGPPMQTSTPIYSAREQAYPQSYSAESRTRRESPWAEGQPLMHGFLGVSSYSKVEVAGGSVDGAEGDLDHLPLIGGGAQLKLGGERFDIGLEGMLSFSGAADAKAFVISNGSALVAVDVDLFIFELYGGPFISVYLGEKVRAYASGGPLLQWAQYDQDDQDDDEVELFAEKGSGFGYGLYVRTGLEIAVSSRTLVGLGVRWSDSSVDLGGELDDLEIEGIQGLFTVSQRF